MIKWQTAIEQAKSELGLDYWTTETDPVKARTEATRKVESLAHQIWYKALREKFSARSDQVFDLCFQYVREYVRHYDDIADEMDDLFSLIDKVASIK